MKNTNDDIVAPKLEKESSSQASIDFGPGQMLVDARVAKGLDIKEVATQLNISEKIINGLERDDYDGLPPAIFIRGYLRNYANLLGIDAEQVLQRHSDSFGEPSGGDSVINTAKATNTKVRGGKSGKSDRSAFWIFLLLIIVLGGLGYFWWSNWGKNITLGENSTGNSSLSKSSVSAPAENLSNTSAENATAVEIPANNIDIKPSPSENGNNAPVEISPENINEDGTKVKVYQLPLPGASENTAVPANSSAGHLETAGSTITGFRSQEQQSQEQQSQELQIQESQDQGDVVTADSNLKNTDQEQSEVQNTVVSASESTPNNISSEEQIIEGRSKLEITFKGRCYVLIKDVDKKVLVSREYKEGVEKTVVGKSPLFLRLGDPTQVEIAYNGEPYDMGRVTKGEPKNFYLQ